MCEFTLREKEVLLNLLNKTPKVVAGTLGIEVGTVNTYTWRVRKKREECKHFLAQTKRFRHILYRKRRGE